MRANFRIVKERAKTTRVNKSKDPEGEKPDVLIDPGLNFEDGWVCKNFPKPFSDVVGVVKDDRVAVRIANDKQWTSFFSFLWSSIELEFPNSLGVKQEELELPNRVEELFGLLDQVICLSNDFVLNKHEEMQPILDLSNFVLQHWN